MAAEAPALRDGAETSEYRLTVRALVAGLAMAGCGVLLALAGALLAAEPAHARDLMDLARTLIWAGVATLGGPTVNYQLSRTRLKASLPGPTGPRKRSKE
ncbi:MAG: hypothetical protein C4525_03240 [Desulfarculus sp.]|nr:MAG: hypothetical protein C4525_03240 [Desulfarculus sp.]